jgi:hypothetical protein
MQTQVGSKVVCSKLERQLARFPYLAYDPPSNVRANSCRIWKWRQFDYVDSLMLFLATSKVLFLGAK